MYKATTWTIVAHVGIVATLHTKYTAFALNTVKINSKVYFKKNLELHILGMLRSITCLTEGSKGV
jgi:hypothetical protein